MNKVCAVVVTYNRKDLLLQCLKALKNQSKPLDAIYLIDNASSDGTSEILLKTGYIEELPQEEFNKDWNKCSTFQNSFSKKTIKFCYIKLRENTGGAGGFYEGVKRAYEDGYDWLWLMDDDAEPLQDALEKLSNYFDEENISALAGVVTTNNEIVLWHRGFSNFNSLTHDSVVKQVNLELIRDHKVLNIDHASFVGVLINRQSIAKIGFPKKKFFIYADDIEYSLRLRKVGQILLIPDSVIKHNVPPSSSKFFKKKLLGRTFYRMKYENYWLSYYEKRNNVWLLKKYRKPLFYFWITIIVSWLAWMMSTILFDDNKLKRINLVISAYVDGVKGNFDNNKPKKILYNND